MHGRDLHLQDVLGDEADDVALYESQYHGCDRADDDTDCDTLDEFAGEIVLGYEIVAELEAEQRGQQAHAEREHTDGRDARADAVLADLPDCIRAPYGGEDGAGSAQEGEVAYAGTALSMTAAYIQIRPPIIPIPASVNQSISLVCDIVYAAPRKDDSSSY